jgi:hypothetical protein
MLRHAQQEEVPQTPPEGNDPVPHEDPPSPVDTQQLKDETIFLAFPEPQETQVGAFLFLLITRTLKNAPQFSHAYSYIGIVHPPRRSVCCTCLYSHIHNVQVNNHGRARPGASRHGPERKGIWQVVSNSVPMRTVSARARSGTRGHGPERKGIWQVVSNSVPMRTVSARARSGTRGRV